MIHIQIQPAEVRNHANRALLERAVRQTLQHTGVDLDADVSVVLSDDERLRQLNHQFLGIDAPTDVLAFPGDQIDPDSQAKYLGDVVVSYERALAQSAAGGHSLGDELQLLVVHGLLHLLDFDHTDEQSKAAMWAVQAEILAILGCAITTPNV
ncbi:MAG: rRNA maturation RNase YbeY [Anaerolineales bacterium]|nr:rRNA maturation RNase YbeY [Anaerolineales bacterium]